MDNQVQRDKETTMCVPAMGDEKKARKDVHAWKVYNQRGGKLYPLFRTLKGYRIDSFGSKEVYSIPRDKTLKSVGWKKGFGFQCPATKKEAIKYAKEYKKRYLEQNPVVVKIIIPEGALYEKGTVADLSIYQAIAYRVERIIVPTQND